MLVQIFAADLGRSAGKSADRVVFRQGAATVVLTLLGAGRQRRGLLPWLVRRAKRRPA